MECFALRRSRSCNISRQSMMHYKGTKKSVPEIASQLKVDGVKEGSVHVDDSARASVQTTSCTGWRARPSGAWIRKRQRVWTQRLRMTGVRRASTATTGSSLRACASMNRCPCTFTTPCRSVMCETCLAHSSSRPACLRRPSKASSSTLCWKFYQCSFCSPWFSTTRMLEEARSVLSFSDSEQKWSSKGIVLLVQPDGTVMLGPH